MSANNTKFDNKSPFLLKPDDRYEDIQNQRHRFLLSRKYSVENGWDRLFSGLKHLKFYDL